MAQKWNLQDIVPPDRPRRTPRRAAPSTSTRAPRRTSQKKAVEAPTPHVQPERVAIEEKQSRREEVFERSHSPRAQAPVRRYVYAAVAIVGILAIGGGITYLLSGAEVKVTPKHQEVNVQGTFTAKLEPEAGDLGYEILMLEGDGEVFLPDLVNGHKFELRTNKRDGAIKVHLKDISNNNEEDTIKFLCS